MSQFGGFDHSAMIDVAWRMLNGQAPYRDFPCSLPPGFTLGSLLAFKLFGVYWYSFVLVCICFSVGTFLWSLFLLGRVLKSQSHGFVVAFAIQMMCTLPTSYWWYNTATDMAAVIFVVSAVFLLEEPKSKTALTSYWFGLLLVSSLKPNVAAILVLPITGILISSRAHRLPVIVLCCSAFGAFWLGLFCFDVSLTGMLNAYRDVSQRAFTVGYFFTDAGRIEIWTSVVGLVLVTLPLLPLSIVLAWPPSGTSIVAYLSGGFRGPLGAPEASKWRFVGAGILCLAAGVNCFVTSGENKLADLAVILVGVILILRERRCLESFVGATQRSNLASFLSFLFITFSFIGIGVAIERHRVLGIGYRSFFEFTTEEQPFRGGFFSGLHSGKLLKQTFAEVEQLLYRENTNGVFFGPRMQWAYAAFKKPSPIGQPSWWHAGVSFARKNEDRYISEFLKSNIKTLVFLKNDMTYYPSVLSKAIQARYEEDQSFASLTVYRLKKNQTDWVQR